MRARTHRQPTHRFRENAPSATPQWAASGFEPLPSAYGNLGGTQCFGSSPFQAFIEAPGQKKEDNSVEATNQDSPDHYKEFIPGLVDGGEISFEANLLPKTVSQASLMTLAQGRTVKNWQMAWTAFGSPNPTLTFSGFITAAEPTTPFADKATLSITIKISGKPTLANWTVA